MKFTKEAQDYFERHPSSDECYITSDGRVFHNKGGAQGFAGTLENQKIEPYKRKVLEAELKGIEDAEKEKTDIEVKKLADDEAKRVAEEGIKLVEEEKAKLLALNIETAEYTDLKNFAKFFEIKTADQKAETLKTAITEFKNQLQKPTE